CEGYEIHMGRTVGDDVRPVNHTADGEPDGYYRDAGCWGTYMHGILDNRVVVERLLEAAGAGGLAIRWSDYQEFKQEQYDRLASLFRSIVDMEAIYKSLQKRD
ncbi:MAG TPA: cobyric acid synthase, partial [Puia sp.]